MNGITISLVTYLITIIISLFIAVTIKIIVVTLEKFSKPEVEGVVGAQVSAPKDDTDIAIAIAVAKQKQS